MWVVVFRVVRVCKTKWHHNPAHHNHKTKACSVTKNVLLLALTRHVLSHVPYTAVYALVHKLISIICYPIDSCGRAVVKQP